MPMVRTAEGHKPISILDPWEHKRIARMLKDIERNDREEAERNEIIKLITVFALAVVVVVLTELF